MGSLPWPEFLDKTPLPKKCGRKLRASTPRRKTTCRVSRARKSGLGWPRSAMPLFLLTYARPILPFSRFFKPTPHDLFAVGIEAISALACYRNPDDYGAYHYAGFDGMDLGEMRKTKKSRTFFTFPTATRRSLVCWCGHWFPVAIPGHTMEDVVTARADYGKLDQPSSPIRIRLNATAVRARHVGPLESARDGGSRLRATRESCRA